MTSEFTGERLIPGHVDIDLWNEHISRYRFAARFASGKTVLDAGCGTGYGAVELAASACSVVAVDLDAETVRSASCHYTSSRLHWLCGSCTNLPLRSAVFDLIVAFEVIEHLVDWQELIVEARRLLAPGGLFLASTPNRVFYEQTRRDSGPNPFHEHEFELEEFQSALRVEFPHVSILTQDHVEGISFRSAAQNAAEVQIGHSSSPLEQSNFFVAVCSTTPHAPPAAYVYVPEAANAIREKLVHIDRLQGEIAAKDDWLADQQTAHQALLVKHRQLKDELERSNVWAGTLNTQIRQLESDIEELHQAVIAANQNADQQTAALAGCVEALHKVESELEARTNWALDLDQQREKLEAALLEANAAREEAKRLLENTVGSLRESRWIRLGRAVGVGPDLSPDHPKT